MALTCDVVVIGAGSGGFGAALAAARAGLSVGVVDPAPMVGGTAVRAGVSCWEPGVGGTGFPAELHRRLASVPHAVGVYSMGRHLAWTRFPGGEAVIDPARAYGDTLRRYGSRGLGADSAFCRAHWHGVVFEPLLMALAMGELLAQTGRCRLLLGRRPVEVERQGARLVSARLDDGETVQAPAWVDASADVHLARLAGCPTLLGQDARDRFGEPDAPAQANGKVNGVTQIYRVTPTDDPRVEPLPADVPDTCWWARGFPVAVFNHYPRGDLNINMLPTMDGQAYLAADPTIAAGECRRRALAHWHGVQRDWPEFRGYRLSWLAPMLGVREGPRIVAETMLTEHDLLAGCAGQRHPDIVALADHAMDTHGASAGRRIGELAQPYGVPYRCLVPRGMENLLVACRGAGFSSLAASSCRLSRTMMQLGQAAGTAVALAAERRVSLPEAPPAELRDRLRRQGVQVDWPG